MQEATKRLAIFRPTHLLAAFALIANFSVLATKVAMAAELYFIDAHSQVDHFVDLDDIIPILDNAGVKTVLLGQRGKITPIELIDFSKRHPGRIVPAVRTKGSIYARNKPKYYKKLAKQFSMDGFGAISEVIMYHAQKGQKAPEVIVAPDDKRVQIALEGAIDKGWPFVIHIEFAAAGSQRDEYMEKMEAMLRAHPSYPFALIHMGQLEFSDVKRLIETHSNIHFMTSHSNPYTVAKSSQPWINMFSNGTSSLKPAWKTLITANPDRFILAFDNVFAEHWGEYFLAQIKIWRHALGELPDQVAKAIAHGNAERLWKLSTVR